MTFPAPQNRDSPTTLAFWKVNGNISPSRVMYFTIFTMIFEAEIMGNYSIGYQIYYFI